MKIRKLNRAFHRDIGYFFFGMCIIYGLSGIALNHRHHWNPNYSITKTHFQLSVPKQEFENNDEHAKFFLNQLDITQDYRNLRAVSDNFIIYFERSKTDRGRVLQVNTKTGEGDIEITRRRPVFFHVNYLHYNTPKFLWTWFSDIFAGSLIIMAITGLFILKGKNSFRKRGIWFVLPGIIIPLLFLFFYLN
jgi:uncharacterized protein